MSLKKIDEEIDKLLNIKKQDKGYLFEKYLFVTTIILSIVSMFLSFIPTVLLNKIFEGHKIIHIIYNEIIVFVFIMCAGYFVKFKRSNKNG
ncbi:hypothetical protein JK211_14440 [Tatumella sp. JGM130]|uniref:hypothetical protein n=1 Tax=Tatumella sp. JGM130 TaxID=2799797 RepID=UPI001BAFE104|nr:hypothetical protein [Tatumella sp. JGM130]MBS0895213.1 hypothetical protein [Tatumella sp. JGM130]